MVETIEKDGHERSRVLEMAGYFRNIPGSGDVLVKKLNKARQLGDRDQYTRIKNYNPFDRIKF